VMSFRGHSCSLPDISIKSPASKHDRYALFSDRRLRSFAPERFSRSLKSFCSNRSAKCARVVPLSSIPVSLTSFYMYLYFRFLPISRTELPFALAQTFSFFLLGPLQEFSSVRRSWFDHPSLPCRMSESAFLFPHLATSNLLQERTFVKPSWRLLSHRTSALPRKTGIFSESVALLKCARWFFRLFPPPPFHLKSLLPGTAAPFQAKSFTLPSFKPLLLLLF